MDEPELAVIVDELDNVIEYRDRRLVGRHDLHRIVGVWIINRHGQVLIAQRAHTLKNQPGLWGPAGGGTVVKGDSYIDTARRELAEEVGISNVALQHVGTFMTGRSFGESRMCAAFVGTYDGDISTLVLQTQEVASVRWINSDLLVDEIAQRPDQYVINMALVHGLAVKPKS